MTHLERISPYTTPQVQDTYVNIQGVTKRFGRLEVLRGVDLAIQSGRITAIVGHNGSGKSTLIKALLGLVKPDAGVIEVDGVRLDGDSTYRARIGYMAQSARFPDNLTAADLFSLLEDVRDWDGLRKEELIRLFGLEHEIRKTLRTLSGGTRQKVSAVMAFMFGPDLLILDEPTAGLDPVASSGLKDLVAAEKQRGRTVLLTSHIMNEIEELSDVVVCLQDGRIRFEGDVDAIRLGTGEVNLERAIAQLMVEKAA